jgi:hypothetical protein
MHLHVSTRKGLFIVAADGSRSRIISRHFLGDNVSLTLADPRSKRWYAALDHGHFGAKVHRSDDQGKTWQEIAVPVYPPKPSDAPDKAADGRPMRWDLYRIWSLVAGSAEQPGRLWCGTIPGALFRSDDHGDSWHIIDRLWNHPGRLRWMGGGADFPGIHSICVDPRDAKTVRVAVSCGGVWTTTDDGATWDNDSMGLFAEFMPPDQRMDPGIQDVHQMVQCRAQPDYLWIQHHNGIFRSVDGARNWQHCPDVPPSGIGFGFPVAVHPADGKVVVTRTHDGGATWEICRKGLPQDDAYDLTYRHALDISRDGSTLAFGSTTGALWCSHDGGDAWHEISAHLPPIHAVRVVE